MRKILVALCGVLALLVGPVGPASADSTTVAGTGDISTMFVNNDDTAVKVKIYGPGGKCDVRYVAATLKGTDGVTYKAVGGCYPGGVWIKSLERGTKVVPCADYKLSYNTTGKFWRFVVPRSCLGKLTNKVRVSGELTYSPTPGEAGPTRALPRG